MKDLSAISPDAEIRPYRCPVDLQAGFCHPPLRHIVLATVEKSAQADTSDGSTGEKSASGETMQRLECEVALSFCQRV